jgi:AcrR family transcriptional regulator
MSKHSYHKENLRQDLIDAGRAYVEKHGHVTLSVRTLAQQLGVSAGAPYHHFADRRLLLLAIASEGFKTLTDEAAAIASGAVNSRYKLIALGLHFIDFAERSPRLFELMYQSELSTPKHEHEQELEKYHQVGQQLIRSAIASGLKRPSAKDVEIRGIAFWAFIFGFAALRRMYSLQSFERFSMTRDAVARSVVTQAATAALAK